MDYGTLIGDAWRTTWRNRYLWGLALFAGGAVGVSRGGLDWGGGLDGRAGDRTWEGVRDAVRTNGGVDWSEVGPLGALRRGDWRMEEAGVRAQEFVQNAAQWAAANAGWLILGAALVAVLALALVVLGLIARGGMAKATVDLANGGSSSLSRMWRAGTRLAWRYAGLWLILAALAIAVASIVGGIVAAGIGAAAVTDAPRMVWGIGALIGVPFALAAAVAGIALSVIVAYAERAIYAEDAGPVEALKVGWRVLRGNVTASLVLWLVNVALSIGVGIAIALGGMALVGVLGSAGAALWFTTGWSWPLIAYGTLGIGAVVAVALVVGAVVNTFFWNYWTLAYVRLTGRQPGSGVIA
jgi:hypothetical protein